jgi:hypothetical protein
VRAAVVVVSIVALAGGCDRLLGLDEVSDAGHGSDARGDAAVDALPSVTGNLVLHVPFDTLSGSGANCTPDATGRHSVACVEPGFATIELVLGRIENAFSLESGAYLQTDSSDDFSPAALTVSVWVNIQSASEAPSGCVIEKAFTDATVMPQTSAVSWQLCFSDATDLYVAGDTGGSSQWAITLNQTSLDTGWHLLTMTWDGTTVALWVDAAKVGTHPVQILYDTNPITIGTEFLAPNAPSGAYNAYVDDLRIYNIALSSGQIATLFDGQ